MVKTGTASRSNMRQKECVCKDASRDELYIQCENCEQWYHGICVSLTKSITNQIKNWYCSSCPMDTVWNPCCSRPECVDHQRHGSKYCSDVCGMSDAASKMKLVYKTIRYDIPKLDSNVIERNMVKKRIRYLERKQIFLDDCIENAQLHRKSKDLGTKERQRCGFDRYFLVFEHNEADAYGIERGTICENLGKCFKHDGWELVKSQEIQMELDFYVGKYKQLKRDAVIQQFVTEAILKHPLAAI